MGCSWDDALVVLSCRIICRTNSGYWDGNLCFGLHCFFAASLAPVMWVVTSEMYPTSIRGTAMSFSTSISWICSLLVVQFFPWMLNSFGGTPTFGVFALLSLLAFLFIKFYIPETKGKSLEEIEKELGLTK